MERISEIGQAIVRGFAEAFGLDFTKLPGYRAIKEVDEWDGSASRWDSTEDYCNDCLINVNSQAGNTDPDDWKQSHCKLPVREPGDGSGTYVKQAVYAAAGGRGITAVTKPADVSDDDWEAALKKAANELIAAYNEMDEVAPEGVYEVAGKERPEERASTSIGSVYDALWNAFYQLSGSYWLQDIYMNDDQEFFAIANSEGILYQFPLTILEDGSVRLGEGEQVVMDFLPAPEVSLTITRQTDGRLRWVGLVCTSVLNRINAIDSRALFDSFLTNIEETGEYPEVDFMHQNGILLGDSDYVARDGYSLLATGLVREDDVGEAIAQTLEEDDEGYWGTSIQFTPTQEPTLLRIADGVSVPVYDEGVLRRITICPEEDAASWFTNISRSKEGEMEKTIKEKLKKLLGGDDDLVAKVEAEVDNVNSRVADGAIARTTEGPEGGDTGDTGEPQETPTTLEDAVRDMSENVATLAESFNDLITVNNATQALVAEMEQRIAALEGDREEMRREWVGDLPIRVPVHDIVRPRSEPVEGDDPEVRSTKEKVDDVLAAKGLAL